MKDEPPQWLREVVTQHRPISGVIDMSCSCMSGNVVVSWTPEHLARMIHMALSDSIAALYV